MKLGLCSITFRNIAPEEVIGLAAAARVEAIEWSGDSHLPPGDLARARWLRGLTEAAGIACASYGSYFVAGASGPEEADAVLATARELGADTVRFWPGHRSKASTTYSSSERMQAVQQIRSFCEKAQDAGIVPGMEYHRGLLTDCLGSTLQLFDEVSHPALRTYWQWEPSTGFETAVSEVHALLERVHHLHIFNWSPALARHSLVEREEEWRQLLAMFTQGQAMPNRVGFIEFLPGDPRATLAEELSVIRRSLGLR